MIIIAIPNIIQQKGLAALIREIDASIKIYCTKNDENIDGLISRHKPSIIYIHSSITPDLKLNSLNDSEVRIIRVINEKPPSFLENHLSFGILYLDEKEATITKNIKRNLALSTKADKNNVKDNNLSDREKSVVREIALGKTNKEIADNLFISAHTVITHRKNITRKLGIKTVSGLTVYAILNKLIQMEEI